MSQKDSLFEACSVSFVTSFSNDLHTISTLLESMILSVSTPKNRTILKLELKLICLGKMLLQKQ